MRVSAMNNLIGRKPVKGLLLTDDELRAIYTARDKVRPKSTTVTVDKNALIHLLYDYHFMLNQLEKIQ